MFHRPSPEKTKFELIKHSEYGSVYKCSDTSTPDSFYEATRLYINFEGWSVFEIATLKRNSNLDHPNIQKTLYYDTKSYRYDDFFIVNEFVSDKECTDILDNLLFNGRLVVLYGIANAMNYLHKKDILYYGLCMDSILINEETNEPKLCEIGYTKCFRKIYDVFDYISPFHAPETIEKDEYTQKSEVYSYAMIMYRIIVGKDPYVGLTDIEIVRKVFNKERPYIPNDVPSFLSDLIEQCWSEDPKSRPNFENILESIQRYAREEFNLRLN